jgi:hypothetical protein
MGSLRSTHPTTTSGGATELLSRRVAPLSTFLWPGFKTSIPGIAGRTVAPDQPASVARIERSEIRGSSVPHFIFTQSGLRLAMLSSEQVANEFEILFKFPVIWQSESNGMHDLSPDLVQSTQIGEDFLLLERLHNYFSYKLSPVLVQYLGKIKEIGVPIRLS